MNNRIDFLLMPGPLATPEVADVVGSVLALGFAAPVRIDVAAGGYQLLAVCEASVRDRAWQEVDGARRLVELNWPEPVGCRIFQVDQAWHVESDYIAFRPVYHAPMPGAGLAVSSRPDLLAALAGMPLSRTGLMEQLLIGFNLGDHTPFHRVSRLSEGEKIVVEAGDAKVVRYVITDPALETAGSWIDQTAAVAQRAFESGYLLEMSGGIDNRLVLALALSVGARPPGGFTIGSEASEDLQVARTVAARFEIPHEQIVVEPQVASLVEDGKLFAAMSSFSMNASYAGLVGVLERLGPRREGQVGGLGGEFALGSYYTPFDRFMIPPLRPRWVRYRIMRAGVAADVERICAPGAFEPASKEIVAHALQLLDALPGTWRQKVDELYIRQKLRQFNGIVLTASARWYHPIHPLHFHSHLAYARTLDSRLKTDRQTQMRLISSLCPDLGAIPYYGQRRVALTPAARVRERLRFARATMRKLRRRLAGTKSSADLGAVNVVAELFRTEAVRASLAHLAAQDELGLVPELLDVLDEGGSGRREHEIGVLIVTAWALESLEAISASLSRARRETR